MLNITLVGDRQLTARLGEMPDKVHRALLKKVTGLALKLEAKVKGKLSGEVLHVRTGALRRSIFNAVTDEPTSVIAKVASSGDVKYAGAHEFGAHIPPHDIVPVKAQALAFMAGGKLVFAKRVHHPGATIPERSFLRSSLTDMREEIVSGLKQAVLEGVRAP
jgi:phage gpG-like protein